MKNCFRVRATHYTHKVSLGRKSLVFINCTVCFNAFKVECKKAEKGIASKVTLLTSREMIFHLSSRALATQLKHLSIVART